MSHAHSVLHVCVWVVETTPIVTYLSDCEGNTCWVWGTLPFQHLGVGKHSHSNTSWVWETLPFQHLGVGKHSHSNTSWVWETLPFQHLGVGKHSHSNTSWVWETLISTPAGWGNTPIPTPLCSGKHSLQHLCGKTLLFQHLLGVENTPIPTPPWWETLITTPLWCGETLSLQDLCGETLPFQHLRGVRKHTHYNTSVVWGNTLISMGNHSVKLWVFAMHIFLHQYHYQ